ncbi:LOW QUALITY PROTEIN: OPS4 Opaque-phase-specific protein OP4 [Candida maltosa Xu316]
MKLNIATATLILASISSIAAAPASGTQTRVTELTVREVESINHALANLQHYNAKRDLMTSDELLKRESQIVTDVLTAIKDTNLAPGIITYIINDPTLSGIATNVIVAAIKSGVINLDTLLKSLNDSAVDVIQDLINDCAFYQEIYKLVLQQLANLPNLIGSILGLNANTVSAKVASAKRELMADPTPAPIYTRDTQDILTSLMESLKSSGLANQVVEALVVDDQFYTWGANLIEQLFDQKAITLGDVISALLDSGLIPSLIKAFLNIDTLKTVIVNALAAAFGNCATVTPTTTFVTSPTASTTISIPSLTGSGTVTCKKRKKRRNY